MEEMEKPATCACGMPDGQHADDCPNKDGGAEEETGKE